MSFYDGQYAHTVYGGSSVLHKKFLFVAKYFFSKIIFTAKQILLL